MIRGKSPAHRKERSRDEILGVREVRYLIKDSLIAEGAQRIECVPLKHAVLVRVFREGEQLAAPVRPIEGRAALKQGPHDVGNIPQGAESSRSCLPSCIGDAVSQQLFEGGVK